MNNALFEALKVLGYETIADAEKRQRHFRAIQAGAQQRADRGDPTVDMAKIKAAKQLVDDLLDERRTAASAQEVADLQEVLSLPVGPVDTVHPPQAASPLATPSAMPQKMSISRARSPGLSPEQFFGMALFGGAIFLLGRLSKS